MYISITKDLAQQFTPPKGKISFFTNGFETGAFRDQINSVECNYGALAAQAALEIEGHDPQRSPSNFAQVIQSFLVSVLKRDDLKNKLSIVEDVARKQFAELSKIWSSAGLASLTEIKAKQFFTHLLEKFNGSAIPPFVGDALARIVSEEDPSAQPDVIRKIFHSNTQESLPESLKYLLSV